MAFSVILVALWVSITAHAQQCQLRSKYGKALANHGYKKIASRDLGECIIQCSQDLKCQSSNWNLVSSVCEFNDAKYENHPKDLVKREDNIYMTSMEGKKAAEKQLKKARKSCKEILVSGESKGDGEYWIDPGNTGNPLKVYCDMTTDGGRDAFTYFLNTKVTTRRACGSFTVLPEDTSILSKNCNNWGMNWITKKRRSNKWSWLKNDELRIYRTIVRWADNYQVRLYSTSLRCDDADKARVSTLSNGDRWLVYLR
ncbi:hypothetical protein QZH41_018726 [Actinostola sp. cb2023]|nr:hypothetical protein QZH41_018726 [Actinostola sp. cb2023]